MAEAAAGAVPAAAGVGEAGLGEVKLAVVDEPAASDAAGRFTDPGGDDGGADAVCAGAAFADRDVGGSWPDTEFDGVFVVAEDGVRDVLAAAVLVVRE